MTRSRGRISKSVRAQVFARDPAKCAICGWTYGQPTRRSKGRPHHKGLPTWFLELDHIIPFSKGGSNTADNLQILCSGCNASKGARLT